VVLTIAFAISSLPCEPPRAFLRLHPQLIAQHKSKNFLERLVNHMYIGPILIAVWSGDDAARVGRQLAGATDPLQADPESISGRYGLGMPMNIVYWSDSPESAEREISLFFKDDRIFKW